MKQVTILAGLSGTGKTHLRNNSYLSELPCIDMAGIYREFPEFDWPEAFECFLKRLREALSKHDHVVVEGYFQARSKSLRLLLDDLKVAGAWPQIIRLQAPTWACMERLEADLDAATEAEDTALAREIWGRMEMLARCSN
jgi:predicted kinase